ncbi:hypothetical protein HID58_042530 [Brassica napus]|uniref:Uncharacterized protein n=1 Tax=Brassica napus TaxID=3708 RepID=A0ABQ8BDY9_BRANA|nr:hypothetical protein HID58_042530 [Brassica napus]
MFDTLCLRGLASAEMRKEIAPPELITGRGTIKLPSRLVCRKVSERIKHITLPEHFPKREAPPHLELLQNVRAYTHLCDARVPCCLWGKFAEILYEGCSKDEEGKPICLIRFVDEVKHLAICEGHDETLDLEEVKSIQDKRDKWMLFPKRTIHGHLESTQNSVNLNEEHIEGLSTPSTTPSTKRKGAWSDPPRDITSTSKNLRSKTIKVEKMSDLEAEAGKKT